ncbi:hypothetical protein HF521_014179 [Silurus meridionalis]|uniref:Little elongation complex subunit 1 C-terminal domain-containing protein n=1 Tax=Silurus meridionalis TaxID=175797 RepID=A0A8T0A889_SILME|nr:hypothetical protein HF521_014179 [Silurus meridionalis]
MNTLSSSQYVTAIAVLTQRGPRTHDPEIKSHMSHGPHAKHTPATDCWFRAKRNLSNPPKEMLMKDLCCAVDKTSTHHPLPPQTRRPPIPLYRPRRDVHPSSSTATDETSTHPPLPPQTRRPPILLYRPRQASTHPPLPPQADVHSSSSTAAGRRPLILLYRRRQDVHSSSSTATDETPTHPPLPQQAGVHSSSSTATDETSTHPPLPPQTRRPLIILYRRRRDLELELQLVSPPQLELELQLVSPPQLELELQLVSPPQLELELDEPPGDTYRAITSTLKALLKDKSLTFQKSSWYGDDLCPAAWDYVFSLDLLCAQLGWIWTVSHVIRKSVWLILNTWLKQTQTEETQFRNVSVAAIFRLLAHTYTKRSPFLLKILHSILFLGQIHPELYEPEKIFEDSEILKSTMEAFPGPFKCSSQNTFLLLPGTDHNIVRLNRCSCSGA